MKHIRTATLLALLACTTSNASGASPIMTESGPLTGTVSADGKVDEYLGIPYAAPPVVGLRWMPPQPYGKWTGTLAAATATRPCTQAGPGGAIVGEEDCLHLNV